MFGGKKKREEAARMEMPNWDAYKVACIIKEALITEGYKVDEPDIYLFFDKFPYGQMRVYLNTEEIRASIGNIQFCDTLIALEASRSNLRMRNASAGLGHYFAVELSGTGILLDSTDCTGEVPNWLNIGARVIVQSYGDDIISDPDWVHEHPQSKQYTNVMFR